MLTVSLGRLLSKMQMVHSVSRSTQMRYLLAICKSVLRSEERKQILATLGKLHVTGSDTVFLQKYHERSIMKISH